MEHNEEINMLTVIDEDGNEIECEILFTFDSEEYAKAYVVYTPLDEEFLDEEGYPQVHVSAYTVDESGNEGGLEPIEDEAEWDMVEEVVETFLSELEADNDEESENQTIS